MCVISPLLSLLFLNVLGRWKSRVFEYRVLGIGHWVYGIWYMVGGELMYEEGNRSQSLILKEEEGAPTSSSYY